MQLGALWTVLGFSLLVCVWGQDPTHEFGVSISGTEVVLTCPDNNAPIKWKKNKEDLKGVEDKLILKDSETEYSGLFFCKGESDKEGHFLYLKARVCSNCMEMDFMTVAGIIFADVFITLGVLILVYYWSKRQKAKGKPVIRGGGSGGRTRGANKERPPPVPNPDYEPIRKGQRDLYAGLNQRAI